MSKAHPDIEAHLDFSEKYRKQIEAHQHETAQLLTDMEQLQGEVRNLLDENEQLNAECDAKDARIVEDVDFEEVPSSSISPESPFGSSDTSFFTSRFPEDTTKKNIREAIDLASSKADACRRIMALERQGYIILSNVGDDRKAELINPYAQHKFTLTGEDFKKARNNRPKKK